MPSRIKVDEIAGSSGNTITIPSGQTLDASSGTLTLPASALSTLNASNLSSGTVPNARLSGITRDKLDLISTASDASIVAKGTTGVTDGYIQLNCSENSHGIKIKSPVHASGANYTLVMPPSLGTSNQVLRMNSGATALEFATASSDFVKLASTTTASAASISLDGYFSSTYDFYVIYVTNYNNATSSQYPQVRFRRSNADVTTSNYLFNSGRLMRSSGGHDLLSAENGYNQSYIRLNQDSDNNTITAHSYVIQIPNPLDTTVYPAIIFDGVSTNFGNGDHYRRFGFGRLLTSGALSGITFFSSSGNISGTFKLYGIKA